MMEFIISLRRLREEIFSRLLSEVLASVQDSVQKEMGLGLEGLRQQLSEMIATSVESSTQQAPDLARTQVGTREQHCNSAVPFPRPPPPPFVSVCFKAKGKKHRRSLEKEKKIEFGRGDRDGYFLLIRVRLCRKEDGKFKRFARAVVTCRHRSIREIRLFRSTHCCTVNYS